MIHWRIGGFSSLAWVVLAAACANAQTPTPSAARLATLAARSATSEIHGKVSLTPQGSGTMVNVELSQPLTPGNQAVTLMSGSDCGAVIRRAATLIPLNNINGTQSQTVVAIPISAFTSGHFIVDVRNTTARAAMDEACAQL
jgi:hypothetical protein